MSDDQQDAIAHFFEFMRREAERARAEREVQPELPEELAQHMDPPNKIEEGEKGDKYLQELQRIVNLGKDYVDDRMPEYEFEGLIDFIHEGYEDDRLYWDRSKWFFLAAIGLMLEGRSL